MSNIRWHNHTIDKASRRSQNQHGSCTLWFTGLSGSGKSTIAGALEAELVERFDVRTYLLDGDNVRHRLCKDLGFNEIDRIENIRRVGEISRLFVDAGIITLTAFISPFAKDRKMARDMMEDGEFIEIFVDTPIEECERRDPKQLYQKARAGLIKDFTGIDSTYEPPTNPEITLDSTKDSIEQSVETIIAHLINNKLLLNGDASKHNEAGNPTANEEN